MAYVTKEMKQTNWRKGTYINQYDEICAPPYPNVRNRKKTFYKCQKLICVNKENGTQTCGIVFSNGVMRIGIDVWRLSNSADCCEYPFRTYPSMDAAALDYDFRPADSTILFYRLNDESEEIITMEGGNADELP